MPSSRTIGICQTLLHRRLTLLPIHKRPLEPREVVLYRDLAVLTGVTFEDGFVLPFLERRFLDRANFRAGEVALVVFAVGASCGVGLHLVLVIGKRCKRQMSNAQIMDPNLKKS